MAKAISIALQLMLFLGCNTLSAQINSKSQVHQPSGYTAPFNLQLFERAYSSENAKITPVSKSGIAVVKRYNQFNNFPSQISEGRHKVYAIAENNNTPAYCYSALASVIKKTEGDKVINYITDLQIDNQVIDFELSGEVVNCKTNVLWKCGTKRNGEAIYCGFEIYFLDDLEQYNSPSGKVSYLYKAIGLSENEIANHYSGSNQFQVRHKYNDDGIRAVEVQHAYLNLTYYLMNDKCYLVQIVPNKRDYASLVSKINDSLYQSTRNGLWIIERSPVQYLERITNKDGDFFVVYNEEFRNELTKVRQSSNTIENSQSVSKEYDMPVYGSSEFYDGYQIVDFAKQIKFKPKNYKVKEWENAVITVFATNNNSAATSRQLNIEAMYLCDKQADVMYRRYNELYGHISKSIFNKYCRLFIILIKTDDINRY